MSVFVRSFNARALNRPSVSKLQRPQSFVLVCSFFLLFCRVVRLADDSFPPRRESCKKLSLTLPSFRVFFSFFATPSVFLFSFSFLPLVASAVAGCLANGYEERSKSTASSHAFASFLAPSAGLSGPSVDASTKSENRRSSKETRSEFSPG